MIIVLMQRPRDEAPSGYSRGISPAPETSSTGGHSPTPPERLGEARKYGLLIVRCSDPLMWYADKVGQVVPFHGAWVDAYKSRDSGGFTNVVRFEDAFIVAV